MSEYDRTKPKKYPDSLIVMSSVTGIDPENIEMGIKAIVAIIIIVIILKIFRVI